MEVGVRSHEALFAPHELESFASPKKPGTSAGNLLAAMSPARGGGGGGYSLDAKILDSPGAQHARAAQLAAELQHQLAALTRQDTEAWMLQLLAQLEEETAGRDDAEEQVECLSEDLFAAEDRIDELEEQLEAAAGEAQRMANAQVQKMSEAVFRTEDEKEQLSRRVGELQALCEKLAGAMASGEAYRNTPRKSAQSPLYNNNHPSQSPRSVVGTPRTTPRRRSALTPRSANRSAGPSTASGTPRLNRSLASPLKAASTEKPPPSPTKLGQAREQHGQPGDAAAGRSMQSQLAEVAKEAEEIRRRLQNVESEQEGASPPPPPAREAAADSGAEPEAFASPKKPSAAELEAEQVEVVIMSPTSYLKAAPRNEPEEPEAALPRPRPDEAAREQLAALRARAEAARQEFVPEMVVEAGSSSPTPPPGAEEGEEVMLPTPGGGMSIWRLSGLGMEFVRDADKSDSQRAPGVVSRGASRSTWNSGSALGGQDPLSGDAASRDPQAKELVARQTKGRADMPYACTSPGCSLANGHRAGCGAVLEGLLRFDSQRHCKVLDVVLGGVEALSKNSWSSDNAAKVCGSCSEQFGMLTRRHHCRTCGRIYCNDCLLRSLPTAAAPELDAAEGAHQKRIVHHNKLTCHTCFSMLHLMALAQASGEADSSGVRFALVHPEQRDSAETKKPQAVVPGDL